MSQKQKMWQRYMILTFILLMSSIAVRICMFPMYHGFQCKIIQCLQKNENALVQSPTGTGKTLSLLCSTLSWVYHQQKVHKKTHRIIYTSRTHSQLNQILYELKKTCFDVKVAQLASRDHTCINLDLKELSGQSKELECRLRTIKKEGSFCKYFHHEQYFQKLPLAGSLSDLEEIISRGKSQGFCPYYYEKSCKNIANVILMPYNYIFDPKLVGEDLSAMIADSIVIFDEGHNITSVCEQTKQFKITLQTIERALHQISQLREYLLGNQQGVRKSKSEPQVFKSTPSDLEMHAGYISCLHGHIQTLDLPADEKGIIMSASEFLQFLIKGSESFDLGSIQKNMDKLIQSSVGIKGDTIFKPYWAVDTWLSFLEILNDLFKNRISEKFQASNSSTSVYEVQILYQGSDIKINIFCLDPKICFGMLKQKKPKAIILTSGTLSPLNSWPMQLGFEFAKPLACPHILSKQQINACILTHGPNKIKLNFSFENRNNQQLYSELGKILIQVAEKTIGGIIILTPSYSVLDKVKTQLTNNGFLSKIYRLKSIFFQTKNSSQFSKVLQSYFKQCTKPKGAVFFALARGKISEGLDFSDQKCRALIMVGVPYPAVKDVKIQSKMNYLDAKSKQTKSMNGNQWYICQTIRCINQSIGRIIRHKNDYGSILLIDERFKKSELIGQISSWAKQCLKIYSDYSQFQFKNDLFSKISRDREKESLQAEAFFKSVSGTKIGSLSYNVSYGNKKKEDKLIQKQKKNLSLIDPEKQKQKLKQTLKQDFDRVQSNGIKDTNWSRQKLIFKGAFDKKLPAKQLQDKKQCPVCRYDKKLIKNTQCPHQLCQDCWDIWLKKDLRCPICRIRIRQKYLIKP